MSSFELQTYKGGVWSIDSYYDDRDLAISEAERLDVSGRHAGVRVLMEEYHEPTNTSNYQVIYSRLQKDAVKKVVASRASQTAPRAAAGAAKSTRPARRAPPKPEQKSSGIAVPVLIAVLVLVAGLSAMLLLHTGVDIGAEIGSLLDSTPKK